MQMEDKSIYKETIEKVPIVAQVIKFTSANDMDYGGFLFVLGLVILFFGLGFTDISQTQIFSITIALSPIWLTYLIFNLFYNKWMDKVGKSFALYNGRTTLRIKLPMEITKSPEAMEFVLAQIHNTANPDNLMQTYLQGKRPLTYSLELVSIGGDVRFYVNVPTRKIKMSFEANMYAQYPGVEVTEEAVDYAAEIPVGTKDWQYFSFHMGKKKNGEFPLKTYIEYGLDRMPDEEEKVDPITPTLEMLSSIGPDERVYIQYIIKPFRPDSFLNGQIMLGVGDSWEKDVHDEISKMMNRDPESRKALSDGQTEEMARLTTGERDKISIMERNASKYAYHTGIRWMYFARNDKFDADLVNPMIRTFSQFDMIGRNQIGVRWRTDAGYKNIVPGQLKQIEAWKKVEHKEFKTRIYYNKNRADTMKIFTVEELATIFHLPGQVAVTPSLGRIGSKRGEAPNNLPTG